MEDRQLRRWNELDPELDKDDGNEKPTNEKQEGECVKEDLTSHNPVLFPKHL